MEKAMLEVINEKGDPLDRQMLFTAIQAILDSLNDQKTKRIALRALSNGLHDMASTTIIQNCIFNNQNPEEYDTGVEQ